MSAFTILVGLPDDEMADLYGNNEAFMQAVVDAVEGLLPSFEPGHQTGARIEIIEASWDEEDRTWPSNH
jgi:hypothetical protein